MTHEEIRKLTETIRAEASFVDALLSQIGKVIVGQRYLLERLLVGLLADGHILGRVARAPGEGARRFGHQL